jgi:hypothetical protein
MSHSHETDMALTARNVRSGSKADICSAKRHVRFTAKTLGALLLALSGHDSAADQCPLSGVKRT